MRIPGVVCFNPTVFTEEIFNTGCSNIFGQKYQILDLSGIHTPVSIYRASLQAMFPVDKRFTFCSSPTSFLMSESSLYDYVDLLTNLIFEPIEVALSSVEIADETRDESDYYQGMRDPFYVSDQLSVFDGGLSFAESLIEDAQELCRSLIIDAIRNSCTKLTGNFTDIQYTVLEVD
jgi:hypothetical protein